MEGVWWFFRASGLELVDNKMALEAPMFYDSTLIMPNHLASVVEPYLVARQFKKQSRQNLIREFGCSPDSNKEFDFFICVRRQVNLIGDASKISAIEAEAYNRASEISSFLTLWNLIRFSRVGCGLIEQIHNPQRRVSSIDLSSNHYWLSNRLNKRRAVTNSSRTKISTAVLLRDIVSSPFDGVAKAVFFTKSFKHAKLIKRSLLHLADAILARDASFQLLGAVTAIEIILNQDKISYKQAIRRVESLVGEQAFICYRGEFVFKARHSYVHGGKVVEDLAVAKAALALASQVLMTASLVIEKFDSHEHFMEYLDFVHKAEMLREHWKRNRVRSIKNLLKHYPDKPKDGFLFQFW